jgi:hypothetical protein
MNAYAAPPRAIHHPSPNSFGSSAASAAEPCARPRRIADLFVVRHDPPAREPASNLGDAHSSSHWVALARGPYAGEHAPAHVKALARELGVDTTVAWDALDDMYC